MKTFNGQLSFQRNQQLKIKIGADIWFPYCTDYLNVRQNNTKWEAKSISHLRDKNIDGVVKTVKKSRYYTNNDLRSSHKS